ncbi:uncharacterized protein LOC134238289 [Saccostrea cucullata]|uniref:uncharacterized protein LOC134238289 n=1 Tax=Saccostrea cuccullata TaxID=36930 RepID=UPI002ED488AC
MFGFIVYVLLFIFYSYADETICKNNVTGKNGCCADYYRTNSGSCKPCIGFFGQKCTRPCFFGYYGHGCRKTCNCSSDTHWCDSKSGCVKKDRLQYHDQIYNLEDGEIDTCENNNALESYTLVLTAVGSICVASVFWIMLGLFCRFQWYTYRSRHESGKGTRNIED